MKLNEYRVVSFLSFPINLLIFLLVKHFFGFEIAVLVGIATIVDVVDEFGYLGFGGRVKYRINKNLGGDKK
jgi:hypothetical protein